MHRIRRRDVFPIPDVPVAASRLDRVGEVPPHGHDFLEIALVVRGNATHVSAGGRLAIESGSAIVVRPGSWHGYQDCRDLAIDNIYVGPELFRRELSWVRSDPQLGPVLWPGSAHHTADRRGCVQLGRASMHRLHGWVGALQTAAGQSAAWRLGHLLLIVNEIAGGSASPAPQADPAGGIHPAVLRAAGLLEDELDRPWTLDRLARAVNVAPTYLVRLFSAQLGIPPLAFLARLRAERAAGMLIETDLPISAIGVRVGWPDPNYMSRRFRACFGVSPSGYRASYRR